jgi:proteasome component ECM29
LLQLISSRYADRVHWLQTLLGHTDSDAREAAACLLGIASASLPNSAALNLLSELTSTLDKNRPSRYANETLTLTFTFYCWTTSDSWKYLMNCARFENCHGMLCAIGYLTAGCLKQSYVCPYAFIL